MNDCLTQYYQCPERFVCLDLKESLSDESVYFRFGEGAICYGRYCGDVISSSLSQPLLDACIDTTLKEGKVILPFDPAEVTNNLRNEVYVSSSGGKKLTLDSLVNRAYYLVRPLLPVALRKHLQRVRLNGWEKIPFPHWPVDRTVDNMLERLFLLCLRAKQAERIPFIWFWPDGASSCAMMTHDVETTAGRDFCGTLMDIDDRFGIKAAFQVVPERRYEVPEAYLETIRQRGFEVGVQDLNHDGRLFKNHEQFLARAAKINAYGREWGAEGFRAGVLYRRQDWFSALDFAYEMSVPNVAHLDPQRGGCCTVMPYFVGNLLEIPVTTTQDYSLFHILRQHSIQLWKKQAELIMEKHGVISFIVHPDYIMTARERETYEALLAHLAHLRNEEGVWIALPGEVNRWWRQRAKMRIVESVDGWHIEGEGKERARIAYATEKDGHLRFSFEATNTLG
jgi:hypothetical protein